MQYKCLSIAGFDGSGGAGIQADLKTFSAFGCYGMTVLTALPIQNTQGVKNCYALSLECIEDQLHTIFEDIIPDCIKIGMLSSASIITLISGFLQQNAKHIPIVLDPVMVAKNGTPLLAEEALETLKREMIPLATLLTPNLPEAHQLVGKATYNMFELGEALLELGPQSVLVKGGHSKTLNCDDLFLDQHGQPTLLRAKRILSNNTHGTGCTLSAAICASIARGFSTEKACIIAKNYLSNAIKAAKNLNIAKGCGPVHHFYHGENTLDLLLNLPQAMPIRKKCTQT